ncbi:TadE/TadG family type IV pilus assembly protein [Virgibacillus byunsanensis]|uniref:TadE/TadG family type IV pilus assembly protein n=1 Tax=Virgibacillus byunsanensis TaxID=570945 RepID=A0ABW3LG49_9BACI
MIREEKGQSIVEFTLVIPILLLLLVGIFDVGKLTFEYSSLHFSGQESVRVAGLGGTFDEIETKARNSFNAGDGTKLTVEPLPPPDERVSGEYITITLTYPYQPLTPLFTDPIELSVDSTIRVE